MVSIGRALISVSDKQQLSEFAQGLVQHGVKLVSSGGTAKLLQQHEIPVQKVSDVTGFPEILGGRVKTLHPRIFGGILARPTEEHQAELVESEIGAIDLVVVNLYPFEQTIARGGVSLAEAVEQIDIGGPSLLRAAAKNHERVTVVVDPADYSVILEALAAEGEVGLDLRRRLALKAFVHTSGYDAAIAAYLSKAFAGKDVLEQDVVVASLNKIQGLRYGENPHQNGAFYSLPAGWAAPGAETGEFEQLSGKALSYNNLIDVDGAWAVIRDLPSVAVAVIKHTNPCGAAWIANGDPAEVFRRARATDPLSAFGGIVACNVGITSDMAAELREMFLEVVVAPDYEPDALAVLRKKKKLRLLRHRGTAANALQLRSAAGGILIQELDQSIESLTEAKVVTKREPTPKELADLDFAWRVCKHVKSNAIVFARDGQLVGVGAGQMSRVDSVRLAQSKAQLPIQGTVVASDAFFPFRDGLDAVVDAGATAIVQPGGSIRDQEVIDAADEHGVTMIFTGVRHFKH